MPTFAIGPKARPGDFVCIFAGGGKQAVLVGGLDTALGAAWLR